MAQIALLVPPPGKLTEIFEVNFSTPIWARKSRKQKLGAVIAVIDDGTEDRQALELEASERPHIIDVKPGHHTIAVYDVDGGQKQMRDTGLRALGAFAVNQLFGGSLSSSLDAVNESMAGSPDKIDQKIANDSCAEFDLPDAQSTISFKCQVTAKGIVKLTLI